MANPSADYPSSIHSKTDVSSFGVQKLGSTIPTHTQLEGKQEEEIAAIQSKVGTGPSTPSTGKVLYSVGSGTSSWQDLATLIGSSSPVSSVNTKTGVVVITPDDLVDTSTTHKFTTASDITKLAGIAANADVTAAGNVGTVIHGVTAKTTPVDADELAVIDSAASNVLKKVTWANNKATLKTYFDTLYQSSLGFTAENVANKDTDGTLAANSDTKYASQKATKTYADTKYANTTPLNSITIPTGDVNINSHKLTSVTDPTSNQDAATKNYVDSLAQGLSVKPSAIVATTTTLPTYTYLSNVITMTSTGVVTIDGHALALNDVILVKDETSTNTPYNGLYKVTTAGAVGVALILTRHVNMDSAAEFPGGFVFVEAGTVNGGAGFVCTNSSNPTVGTTNITFTQFSGAGEITAGNGLSKSGNTLSIDTSITVDKTTAQTLTNKTLTSPVINTPTGITKTDVGLSNVTNNAQLTASQLDTDNTLAANSDTRVPSQKAIKAYVDNNFATTTFAIAMAIAL